MWQLPYWYNLTETGTNIYNGKMFKAPKNQKPLTTKFFRSRSCNNMHVHVYLFKSSLIVAASNWTSTCNTVNVCYYMYIPINLCKIASKQFLTNLLLSLIDLQTDASKKNKNNVLGCSYLHC